jgi:AraC family transcriptional regulator, transcriptional activator of pobA
VLNKLPHINVLSPSQLDFHHFGADWRFTPNETHQIFHINTIESVVEKIKFPLSPHRKSVYDFLYLTNGHSLRGKGLHQYEFKKNTFFFLPALQISTHEYLTNDSTGFFCHFDLEVFSGLFPGINLAQYFSFWQFDCQPLVQVNETLQIKIINILNRLLELYQDPSTVNYNLVASYLYTLFLELNAVETKKNDVALNAAQRITQQYKNLLSHKIFDINRVADYASILSISADHLNKCVKIATGRTSQELLIDMILLETKVLLKQSNLSISEIAFKFSETNPSDFSRFFKRKTGVTPKAYRLKFI